MCGPEGSKHINVKTFRDRLFDEVCVRGGGHQHRGGESARNRCASRAKEKVLGSSAERLSTKVGAADAADGAPLASLDLRDGSKRFTDDITNPAPL